MTCLSCGVVHIRENSVDEGFIKFSRGSLQIRRNKRFRFRVQNLVNHNRSWGWKFPTGIHGEVDLCHEGKTKKILVTKCNENWHTHYFPFMCLLSFNRNSECNLFQFMKCLTWLQEFTVSKTCYYLVFGDIDSNIGRTLILNLIKEAFRSGF